jgi:hypothetical protein
MGDDGTYHGETEKRRDAEKNLKISFKMSTSA